MKSLIIKAIFGLTVLFAASLNVLAEIRTKSFTSLSGNQNNSWYEVFPGDGTTCARGQEFSFFYYPGNTEKLIVDFQGGGSCWSAKTCAKESATFIDSVDYLRDLYAKDLEGIYAKDRLDNPIKDWTHVVIPYCTGDIHWGNLSRVYTRKNGSSFTIHHKGAANTKAVLDWVQKKFTKVKNLFVTGCSAGAYGSIYWTPKLKDMYPKAKLAQFGDAGAGVITKDFASLILHQWNSLEYAPTWIPIDWANPSLLAIYKGIGKYYPDITLSQFNNAFDATQTFFYELMGGDGADWSTTMLTHLADIQKDTPNFSSFTATGENHCIIPYNRFYDVAEQNTMFKDWFGQQAEGGKQETISCEDCSMRE